MKRGAREFLFLILALIAVGVTSYFAGFMWPTIEAKWAAKPAVEEGVEVEQR